MSNAIELGPVPGDFLQRTGEDLRGDGRSWKVFSEEGDFAALDAARAFLKAHGFSVGILQTGAPIGVMLGNGDIAKWRTLDAEEKADMHGTLWTTSGSFRAGPVFLDFRDDCPSTVFEALADDTARAAVEGAG